MNHQKGDHLRLIQAESLGLAFGCFNGDDEIAQKVGMERWKLALFHGEGEDIGGFVPAEETAIQFPNLLVIDQQETELHLMEFQAGQYLSDCPSYPF